MDIDRVRYFQIFAETGSLVAASEVLHISQPALSKALKLLEREIGAKLVESEGRGLRLTQAGHNFKRETGPLLQEWLEVPSKLSKKLVEVPTKIGSFEVFTTHFLDSLTKHVSLENLELHEYAPGKLEQAVSDGVIDIGITYLPIPKAQIEFIEITKIRMGIYGSKKFRDKKFEDLPFVVPLHPVEGTPTKVVGLDGWPDHKFPRKIKYRVTMMESALELCRLGLAVAYLPSFVAELHNKKTQSEYRVVEYSNPVKHSEARQGVFLLSRKNSKETELHRGVAHALRSLK